MKKISSQLKKWLQSPEWFYAFFIALLLSGASYGVYAAVDEIYPGSLWGMGYGIAAAVLLLAVAGLGMRRRRMRTGKIKTQQWVQFHVYSGILFFLFVLMHSGFRWPNDTLTSLLFVTSAWVTSSGLFGVFLQKWIPKFLTSGLQVEVLYERIPELIREMRGKADALIRTCITPVRNYYGKNLAKVLLKPQPKLVYFLDITGGIQAQVRKFEYLRKSCSAEEKEKLNELERIYRTKLEVDAHYTLQKALRLWLYLHVPAALLLLFLTALHVFSVLYY